MHSNFRQILVASDFSPQADIALSRAWQIAARHGAALTALHVVTPVGGLGVPSAAWEHMARTPEEAEQVLRQKAEAIFHRQFDHNPVPRPPSATSRTRVGSPVPEIVQEARECSADLIVLGAHGRHFLRNLLLGTTAESVVRSGECPVLVVRKKPSHPYRRILVSIDFSDASRAALVFAQRLAPRAKLVAMHAYEISHEDWLRADGMTNAQLLALHEEYELTFSQRLRHFINEAGLDADAVTGVIRHGYPGTAATRVATELRADLVAVGMHGLRGRHPMLLGSVAEHTLREAHSDVLAVLP